ncbi:MAG TPA: lysylphosphatidylglycerol synthase transmembrane domain-containing protein [Gemmataceae bacterium]|nr:lysylphosphatidylglycerol synthase transmembrane domain-containing protein [Gemmataceae bacterium]
MKKYVRLLGSLILVGLLVWRIDWRQVASAFAQLNAAYWLLALGVYLLTQGVSAARWQMLGHTLGLAGRWRDYLAYYFVGMFFNLVLPTSVGGDVVRAWYLARMSTISDASQKRRTLLRSVANHSPGWAAFLSVLADRVNGLAVLIAVACVAAMYCPTPLPGWIVAFVAGMAAACLLGLAVLPLLPWLRRRLTHPRLTPLLDGAALCLRDRRGMIGVTLLSLVVQLANVVLAWLVGEGLGLQVPPLYYGVLIPLVSILTLLPISLNGMGVRETGTVLLLAPLHVSPASAVTLSLLLFAVYAAASLLGGGVYLFSGWRVKIRARSVSEGMSLVYASGSDFRPKEASGHADPVCGNSDQGRMREPSTAA